MNSVKNQCYIEFGTTNMRLMVGVTLIFFSNCNFFLEQRTLIIRFIIPA